LEKIGSSDLIDALLTYVSSCMVEQYDEITHKLRWLNDVSANTQCEIHIQNFLEVCFRDPNQMTSIFDVLSWSYLEAHHPQCTAAFCSTMGGSLPALFPSQLSLIFM
jgi:hypothetical protein